MKPKTNQEKLIRLASFTQHNPRPVVEISLGGKVIYQNPAIKKMFPDVQTQGLQHPYLEGFKKIIEELKAGAKNVNRDIAIGNRWYRQFFYYIPEFKSILVYGTDITDRKKTEEEKNNFIAIMSHELRNPLTPIMANAQLINYLLEQQHIKHPAIKESIDIIEKQAQVMADLLNDILDVSRLSRHKIQLKKTTINLCEVINTSVKSSMPFIATKEQRLITRFSQNPIYIQADPVRIEQIMVNLINNASKYTKAKGRIVLTCKLKAEKVQINIKDNGMGMESEKMKRIFDLFSGEGQPFMGIGGLGIGLNIVKNLVAMHQGVISVNSKGVNKGSEFVITLPALKKANVKNQKLKIQVKNQNKQINKKLQKRILIVDDNDDIRTTLAKLLEHYGYNVQSAQDGVTAIHAAKAFKPDVALLDIGLPDMSGYELAKTLRSQQVPGSKKMKLIAFTGYGQIDDKRLAGKAGFDHHITKPVDINQLIKLLK